MKVVYVTGAGHIGSTILDIVLGNHPEIQGVGEVNKLHRSGWVTDSGRRCACGEAIPECSFWPEVRHRWASSLGGDDVPRYVHLQGTHSNCLRNPQPVAPARRGLHRRRKRSALSAGPGKAA